MFIFLRVFSCYRVVFSLLGGKVMYVFFSKGVIFKSSDGVLVVVVVVVCINSGCVEFEVVL